MGACAVPGMMDEEVGITTAGVGGPAGRSVQVWTGTLWEKRAGQMLGVRSGDRVSCKKTGQQVAPLPACFAALAEPDLPGLRLSASLPSRLWTYRVLGGHLFPCCGLWGVQVRVCDGRSCTERQATIFGSSWNDGLGFKCNPPFPSSPSEIYFLFLHTPQSVASFPQTFVPPLCIDVVLYIRQTASRHRCRTGRGVTCWWCVMCVTHTVILAIKCQKESQTHG